MTHQKLAGDSQIVPSELLVNGGQEKVRRSARVFLVVFAGNNSLALFQVAYRYSIAIQNELAMGTNRYRWRRGDEPEGPKVQAKVYYRPGSLNARPELCLAKRTRFFGVEVSACRSDICQA